MTLYIPARMLLFTGLMLAMPLCAMAENLQNTIVVENAWSRATAPRASAGVVYLTLLNEGEKELSLVRAETDAAMHVMLHTTQENAQGRVSMMHAEKFVVPPKGEISLAPGGHHIMLVGLKEPLVFGTEISVKLIFEDGLFKKIRVPIKPMRYQPAKD